MDELCVGDRVVWGWSRNALNAGTIANTNGTFTFYVIDDDVTTGRGEPSRWRTLRLDERGIRWCREADDEIAALLAVQALTTQAP